MAITVSRLPDPNRAPNYPWAQWLDEQIWRLEKGKDFFSVRGLRSSAHRAASKVDRTVTIRVQGKYVYLQAQLRPWKRS